MILIEKKIKDLRFHFQKLYKEQINVISRMVIKNEINEVKSIKSWLYEMSIKSVKVICLYPD